MEAGGYVLRIREPDWFEHRLLKGPDTNVNLHVFSAAEGSWHRDFRNVTAYGFSVRGEAGDGFRLRRLWPLPVGGVLNQRALSRSCK